MTVSKSMQKLVTGRADIAIVSEAVATEQSAMDDFHGKLEILSPPFLTGYVYLAFSPRYQSENAAHVEAIWKAIKQLRTSEKFKTLAPSLGR